MVCDFMLNARQCHSLKSMGYSNVPMPCFKLLKEKQKEKQLKKKIWIIYTPLYVKRLYLCLFNIYYCANACITWLISSQQNSNKYAFVHIMTSKYPLQIAFIAFLNIDTVLNVDV